MPHGPSSTNPGGSQPDLANDGASSVYAQTANPARETGDRAGPRRLLPVQPAEHRRRELRDRRERDQPDRHQRIRLAGEPEVGVAEQQDRDDCGPPDAEQQPRQVAARAQTQHPGRAARAA